MNIHETFGGSVTVVLPSIATARRQMMAMRVKHGAGSPIGHRCSNIIELLQMPNPPAGSIQKQMAELERLLVAGE